MNKFVAGWYLVYTMPRHEKKVHNRLGELHINSFLPIRKTLRQWCDRKKYIDAPLFPSYVFLFLNDLKDYYDGISVNGVLNYVRIGRQLAKVDETIVDSIKLVTSQEKEIFVSDQYFQPGCRVLICNGALAGFSGEIVEYNVSYWRTPSFLLD